MSTALLSLLNFGLANDMNEAGWSLSKAELVAWEEFPILHQGQDCLYLRHK